MTPYLDLGMMPLANNLQPTKEAALTVERYPLKVLLCEDCGLSQLSVVVDPEVMFSNYNYRSSVNGGYLKHCNEMAQEFKRKYNLHTSKTDFGSFVIDIAGNDGALLSEFNKVIPGLKSLNIDPARNLAEANEAAGVRQYTRFWSMETAQSLEALGWPKADLITATNVFAHVDNVREFLEAAKFALKDEGVLVLEFPYLVDFIEGNEWSTTYHEHLSYFSLNPLSKMCQDIGLHIADVSKHAIHCGTMRVEIRKGIMLGHYQDPAVDYKGYAEQVQRSIRNIQDAIDFLPGKVAAFAASAKGNVLLNALNDVSRIEFVVDETPEKRHKFSPGVGIEVVPMVHLLAFPVDYLIILSWNFADEIIKRCKAAGYRGKFAIPIPTWKIVE